MKRIQTVLAGLAMAVSLFSPATPGRAQAADVAITTATDQAVPGVVKFSGTLKDSAGQPLIGTAGVTFSLYKDQQGGAALWMETQNIKLDDQGNYTVLLGAASPKGIPIDIFASYDPPWLGAQPQAQDEQARVPLVVSEPDAPKAGNAETPGGMPLPAFPLATPQTADTSTQGVGDISKVGKTADLLAAVSPAKPIAVDNAEFKDNQDNKPEKAKTKIARSGPELLWRNPENITSRNLYYGPGGKDREPHTTVTFVKEDFNGTNPKFDVIDQGGVKWKVKLGDEARPETVASRLVWAVGYYTNDDYFLPALRVKNMPAHLERKRARKMEFPGGLVANVRMKRDPKGPKKIGEWEWRQNPFSGTSELNGLRVVMAVINNWDLKDENNAIYQEPDGRKIYLVSDLGASFGAPGRAWPRAKSRGNIEAYDHARLIDKVTLDHVNFNFPTRPALIYTVSAREFVRRLDLRWIGKDIPLADVKWMGQLLAKLSTNQIHDAFRAAGYLPEEVDRYSTVLADRIAELKTLE